jgi:hypothetical protein
MHLSMMLSSPFADGTRQCAKGVRDRLWWHHGHLDNSLVDFLNPVLPPLDSLILGEVGKQYLLTVEYSGKTYTASTIIPAATILDSIWSQRPARQPDSMPDAREFISATAILTR